MSALAPFHIDPLASRMSGAIASALGDENDKYSGVGRNGVIKMNNGETVKAELLAVGSAYTFKPGIFHNLLADKFIANHGNVTGKEVVAAFGQALGET